MDITIFTSAPRERHNTAECQSEGRPTRIAVIWSRFGPYHLARLRGAARKGRDLAEIVGIEIADTDAEYAWELIKGADRFERHTLFPQRSYRALPGHSIRAAVSAALDRLNPDTVAINGWAVAEAHAALIWTRRSGKRAILMSETKHDDSKRVWWKELSKFHLVRKFDAALVGGVKQREYLISLGMPKEHIFLGYDVVDNAYFRSGATKARTNAAALRKHLQLPERYFFCCTRFLERKNIDGLLAAYNAYRAKCERPWDLIVAGSGPELSKLRSIETSLRIEGVHWPGFLQYEKLPFYYGLASAFVHPAKSEAWGLVVNEAAASGLPLLVSETVGAGYELVEHGLNGFLFTPNNPSAMCEALLKITLASAFTLSEMGHHSCEIASKWTPDHFGSGLLAAAKLSRRETTASTSS
jgi:1,2-diacylglycerol 3-alpha-glucosyltransferase